MGFYKFPCKIKGTSSSLTVGTYSLGNSFWVYVMRRHVLPTIPSPTHVIFKGLKLPFVAILCFCALAYSPAAAVTPSGCMQKVTRSPSSSPPFVFSAYCCSPNSHCTATAILVSAPCRLPACTSIEDARRWGSLDRGSSPSGGFNLYRASLTIIQWHCVNVSIAAAFFRHWAETHSMMTEEDEPRSGKRYNNNTMVIKLNWSNSFTRSEQKERQECRVERNVECGLHLFQQLTITIIIRLI